MTQATKEEEARIMELCREVYRDIFKFLGDEKAMDNLPTEFGQATLSQVHANDRDMSLLLSAMGNVLAGIIAAHPQANDIFHWFGINLAKDINDRLEMLGHGETRQ